MRALAMLAAVLALPLTASAQDDIEDLARRHFAEGRRLVDAGQMQAAYTEFNAGYELSRRPLFLFNMAETSRQMGEPDRARADYERYLEADPGGAMAETARARLAELPPPTAEAAPAPAATLPAATLPDEPTPAPGPITDPDQTGGGDEGWIILVTILSIAALAGAGVALGVHFGTQGPECGVGCVDFR